ncbi:putative NXPE family member 3-like [Triplophysa rosa]|uniref:NXPE family member 3-like n=1 Tax=Triplophysa rosa TaxID=992332 RepID=A0A9W7T2U6_TRIRA|nr:putative NXPE family member 3-like [Triplophysa rosa]
MESISLWHCSGVMRAQVALIVAFSSSALLVYLSLWSGHDLWLEIIITLIKLSIPPAPRPFTPTRHTQTIASYNISAFDMGISQEEWDRLQKVLDWPSPDHEITELGLSTSPVHTTFSTVGFNDTYKVGDKISVTITARDHNKNLKTCGGDFFQAKVFNKKLKASVYGKVFDHRNGTHTVDLLLPWEGQAQVSIRLMHSSEVVQFFKKYWETSFPRNHYYGYFEGPGPKGVRISEKVKCNLKWIYDGSWSKGNCCCEYKDEKTETVWQCERPKQLSCDYWVYHERGPFQSPLTPLEKQLIASKLTNVGIPGDTRIINVLSSSASIGNAERCRSGLTTPVPAGFYFQDVWKSFVCNTRRFSFTQMADCLANKIIYMMGDSTTRQWFEFFERSVPGLKRLNLHTNSKNGPLMALEMTKNIIIHWRPHGLPLQFRKMPAVDLHYISNEIDQIAGGRHTVVVFTIFAHLVVHPLTFYVRKVAKIRQAVVLLLKRAPETTVIIKSGNTGLTKNEYGNDWYRMQLNTVMSEMFSDIKGVVYMDVWQMTSCHYSREDIHPVRVIVVSELDMLLSHVCPS